MAPPNLDISGWFECLCDQPVTDYGHQAYGHDGCYALIWPERRQGNLAGMTTRLVQIGKCARMAPAQPGQAIQTSDWLCGVLSQKRDQFIRQIQALGGHWQISFIFKTPVLREPTANATIRERHSYMQNLRRSLETANAPLKPFLSDIKSSIVAVTAPQQSGLGRAKRHILVERAQLNRVLDRWVEQFQRDAKASVVGPLPPFAFAKAVIA